jgi:hypothetical protein
VGPGGPVLACVGGARGGKSTGNDAGVGHQDGAGRRIRECKLFNR